MPGAGIDPQSPASSPVNGGNGAASLCIVSILAARETIANLRECIP